MRKVRVLIERGGDGTYGAYIPDGSGLDWGASGEGASIDAAVADFKAAYDDLKACYREAGRPFEEAEFEFGYDVPSFLDYYKGVLTLAGLSRVTGINQRQLSQYANGYRRPSGKTSRKIEGALHRLGAELSSLRLL